MEKVQKQMEKVSKMIKLMICKGGYIHLYYLKFEENKIKHRATDKVVVKIAYLLKKKICMVIIGKERKERKNKNKEAFLKLICIIISFRNLSRRR